MKKTLKKAEKVNEVLEAWKLHHDDKNELVFLRLQPQEEIPAHQNPYPVLFFLIHGKVEIQSDKEIYLLEENDLLPLSPELNRSLKNISTDKAELLVIKQIN